MALWASEQNLGWMEWVMGDTPYTVMSTRVPVLLKIQLFNRWQTSEYEEQQQFSLIPSRTPKD